MNLHELNPPLIEPPADQIWYRIQRTRPRSDSVRRRGFIIAPAGTASGRFDLPNEPTAYLADSPQTSLYESLFRREALVCPLAQLKSRSLVSWRTVAGLRLIDIRGAEERFPVLQALRYSVTQAFAQTCKATGAHGILYASAQHPHHGCICLFSEGIERMKVVASVPLVQFNTGRLHRAVAEAAHGSQVPIVG